ncbi:MAG TPA: hypothetical protein VLH56_11470 [Dissulfurispiraceae bacterium]|nr:hypothetical protein [Dissulfurispiraceae bacterium]
MNNYPKKTDCMSIADLCHYLGAESVESVRYAARCMHKKKEIVLYTTGTRYFVTKADAEKMKKSILIPVQAKEDTLTPVCDLPARNHAKKEPALLPLFDVGETRPPKTNNKGEYSLGLWENGKALNTSVTRSFHQRISDAVPEMSTMSDKLRVVLSAGLDVLENGGKLK